MHVALVTLEYPPAYRGGLGVHVAGLVDYLRRQGDRVDVYYVGPQPAPAGVIAVPAPEQLCPEAGPVHVARLPGAQRMRARHEADPYDVVHCHDWHGALLAGSLWQCGVPMVTTCHLPAATRFHYASAQVTAPAAALERLALRLSQRVIAVSHFVAMELERSHRTCAHKIHVIHNGTDPQLFSGPAARSGALILAVGRISAQKGFAALPDILARVRRQTPQATLRVIGEGPDGEALRAELRQHGVAAAVELRPFADRQVLAGHYRQARVLAVPSVYEPFGLVAIEAMACSVPAVAYATGGLAEIITDGVDGILIPPGDRDGFARALARLLNHPEQAERLGRQARRTVLERFTGELSHARTRALYRA